MTLSERRGVIVEESLFDQVREGLHRDGRVFVAGEIVYSPAGMGWTETVDVIVAPVSPIYDAERLNKFMDSLVPGIARSARDGASHYDKESDFSVGRLYFDETLGVRHKETRSVVEAYQADALARAGVTIGETTEARDEKLQRRVWVRVYPSSAIAKIVADYEVGVSDGSVEPNNEFSYLQDRISPDQLRKLKETDRGRGILGFLK